MAVAIPCYNGARYIAKCIEAILRQTNPPDKVLVIDDGSIDESVAIIKRYPVNLIQHEQNLGLSEARNTALAHAGTNLITYVDTDAYAHPDMLACILKELDNPEVHGAGGQGIEVVQESIYDHWRKLHASQGYGTQRRQGCKHLFGLCMAYRCQVLLSVGGFDTKFKTNGEDMDIGYRLTNSGYRLVYNPGAQVFHQRKDDHQSLRRMMYQWYYGAFIAKRKNGYNPWSLAAGTIVRLLVSDTWNDLFRERSLDLVRLDVEMAIVKLQGLLAAAHASKV